MNPSFNFYGVWSYAYYAQIKTNALPHQYDLGVQGQGLIY